METLEHLMDSRHAAYEIAKAGGFQKQADVLAWREVNRAYVLARDSQRRARAIKTAPQTLQMGSRAA